MRKLKKTGDAALAAGERGTAVALHARLPPRVLRRGTVREERAAKPRWGGQRRGKPLS